MNHIVLHERTYNYIKQIKGSFIFKGMAIVASFLAVPLMIHYLGKEQFGVWSTILSVMSWIVFFDLGIGNGLRNKIAENLAKNDPREAVLFISSGYSLIGLISILLFSLMVLISFFISWQLVFNTKLVNEETLRNVIIISAFFIFLNFWISLINQVLNAVQKTSVIVFGQLISNFLALLFIFLLSNFTNSSLIYLAFSYGISLVVSNCITSLWFYKKRSDLMPRFYFNKTHIKPIMTVGIQFFVIQIAVLVIFTTDKILITQIFGPQFVTLYDVVFKIFSIITIIHSIVTAPLWSSYTDAYHKGDFMWIKSLLKKQLIFFGLIVFVTIVIAFMVKPIMTLWLGNDMQVPIPFIISMAFFVIISSWSNIFAYCVNGLGKIRLQLFSSIIAMIINIPLAIYFTKYLGLGLNGIVFATCLSLSLFAIVGPLQVNFILKNKAQ